MKLHELLETKNRKEQAKRVAQLIDVATAPVYTLVIRYDGRQDHLMVTSVGPDVPVETGLQMLRNTISMVEEKVKEGEASPAAEG